MTHVLFSGHAEGKCRTRVWNVSCEQDMFHTRVWNVCCEQDMCPHVSSPTHRIRDTGGLDVSGDLG
jgi:hypothetical protein